MKGKRLKLIYGKFKDDTNNQCTIAIDGNNLAIGVLTPKRIIYRAIDNKYVLVAFPKYIKANCKMYLSQQMVADLLPMLELFAATGRIEYNDDVGGSGG